jgi:hypothetical protein
MVMVLFEAVIWVSVMAFILTQVVLPFAAGRPWFPMVRRGDRARELKAQEELLRLGDEAEVIRLEAEVEAKRQLLEQARARSAGREGEQKR